MTNEELLLAQLQLGREVLDAFIELQTDKTLDERFIKLGVFDDEPDDTWKITIRRNK